MRSLLSMILVTGYVRAKISTTSDQPNLVIPAVNCDVCYLAAGTRTAPTATKTTSSEARRAKNLPHPSIVFTGYSITSAYDSNGSCIIASGHEVPVIPAFTVTQPSTIASSDFLTSAQSALISHLGFEGCSAPKENIDAETLVPLTSLNGSPFLVPLTSSLSVSSVPSAGVSATANSTRPSPSGPKPLTRSTSQQPSIPSHALNTQAKVAIGVTVPATVIGLLIGAVLSAFKLRKRRQQDATNRESKPSETQPYFQSKGELSAEERQKCELPAESTHNGTQDASEIHELSGDGTRELSTTSDQRRITALRGQELRGEECARELGSSDH